MVEDNRREKLVGLGSEKLADALLELADRSDAAVALIDRLTSSKEEIVKNFKAKLAGLKRAKRFIERRDARQLAERLENMLIDLASAEADAITGIELLRNLYACDSSVFARCDDSYGSVGDFFKYSAGVLFVEYAERIDDKDYLCNLLFDLYEEDDYGVRAILLDKAHLYLNEENMRKLSDRMWERCKDEEDKYKRWHWTSGVASIARQLEDPVVFEKAYKKSWPVLHNKALLDIATVYLKAGEPRIALDRVQRIESLEMHRVGEKDQLLLSIYKELGDDGKTTETAWRIFRRERSGHALEELLKVIGDEEGERIINGETEAVMASARLSYSDVSFLVQVGKLEEAEAYLIKHYDSLDGDVYFVLKPLAETLEDESPLGATLLYRALLDSILSRAVSKYYNHGIRYLKKLDLLGGLIDDWKGLRPHEEYKAEIQATHGRKRSFWSKYPS
jgi:hypothetical protein